MFKISFQMSQLHTNGVLANHQSSSTKDQASLRQFGKTVLSGCLMGYAPFTEGAGKGELLAADVGELQEDDVSEVYFRRKETKVLVSKEGDIFTFTFFERFCTVDRKKVLKSNHPTEFGKTSKKEKNTAVIFKERLTNQILQSNNGNKTNWMQSTISGAYLEASFRVLTSRKDKKRTCHKTSHNPTHRSKLMLSGGQTLHLTYCRNVRLVILRTLMMIGTYQDHGLVSPSSLLLNSIPPRGHPWSVRRLTNIQAT